MIELTLVDTLMERSFIRISKGIYFDNNLKPYRKEFYEKMLDYFESKERFEECILISDILKTRFNHDNERFYRNY